MDETFKHALAEWASGVTAAIVQVDELSVPQKRGLIEDLRRLKIIMGKHEDTVDTEAT